MKVIDIPQVLTQILGFLILVWGLRQFAWGPLLGMLEARREKIAGEFREAERLQAEARELRARYDQELRGIEAQARARLQEAVVEGQKVAAEIKVQAQAEAQRRLERARDEIAHEGEKAKQVLKERIIDLSLRSAEKILRRELDDAAQRRLTAEFIEEATMLP
jgi:F-type H+-transporting ATPase subunit b